MARPKEFDRNKVLDRATRLFWERGFGGTSISDLEAAMGIGRTSIYAAFGAKEDLFMAAIDHYDATYSIKLRNALNSGLPVRQAIVLYFDELMTAFSDPDLPLGCLVTNVAVEGDRGTTRMGRRIAASITRAEDTFYRRCAPRRSRATSTRAPTPGRSRASWSPTRTGCRRWPRRWPILPALRDVVGVILKSVDDMLGGDAANANLPAESIARSA